MLCILCVLRHGAAWYLLETGIATFTPRVISSNAADWYIYHVTAVPCCNTAVDTLLWLLSENTQHQYAPTSAAAASRFPSLFFGVVYCIVVVLNSIPAPLTQINREDAQAGAKATALCQAWGVATRIFVGSHPHPLGFQED